MTCIAQNLASKSGSIENALQFERYWQVPTPPRTEVTPPLYVVKIGYSIWHSGKVTQRERYSSLGIEMITHGDLLCHQDNDEFIVGAGSVLLKRPGLKQRYQTGPAGIVHKRFIDFNGPALGALLEALDLVKTSTAQLRNPVAFRRFFKDAAEIFCMGGSEMHIDLAALAYRMLLGIADAARVARIPPELREIVASMRTHIHENRQISEMASECKMSTAHLHRTFQKMMGSTPARYFRDMKMAQARDLLLYTDRSVKEIAYSLGYEDPFAFSTAFRRSMGYAPTQVRKRLPRDYVIRPKTVPDHKDHRGLHTE